MGEQQNPKTTETVKKKKRVKTVDPKVEGKKERDFIWVVKNSNSVISKILINICKSWI